MSKHFSIWAIQEIYLPLITQFFEGKLPRQAEENAALAAAAAASRGRSTGVVAVLPIFGAIQARANLFTKFFGGTGLDDFLVGFRAAVADPHVTHILLDVDSPGGSVYGLEEAADEIRAAREKKKITAQVNTVAASAAYWLASAADEVVITPSGEAGSIGVFGVHLDFSEMAAKAGVKVTFIQAGKFKAEGHPLKSLDEEAIDFMQKRADEYYGAFVKAVAAGRGVSQKFAREGMGQGRTVGAEDAVTMKLADRIATMDQTIMRLAGRSASVLKAEEAGASLVAEQDEIPVAATDAAAIFDFYKRRVNHSFADA